MTSRVRLMECLRARLRNMRSEEGEVGEDGEWGGGPGGDDLTPGLATGVEGASVLPLERRGVRSLDPMVSLLRPGRG